MNEKVKSFFVVGKENFPAQIQEAVKIIDSDSVKEIRVLFTHEVVSLKKPDVKFRNLETGKLNQEHLRGAEALWPLQKSFRSCLNSALKINAGPQVKVKCTDEGAVPHGAHYASLFTIFKVER